MGNGYGHTILYLNQSAPTFSKFTNFITSGKEDITIPVSLAQLKAQGDETDANGVISAFIVKAVHSGVLLIGKTAATAKPWAADINDKIDSTHNAYWKPPANANAVLDSFTVTAKDNEGNETLTPVQVNLVVRAVNDLPTGAVIVTGNPQQGQTLVANLILGDADGLGVLNYQWFAGGVAIAGAKTTSYTLTANEVGKAIMVVASYTDGDGTSESISSLPTALVSAVIFGTDNADTLAGTAAGDVMFGKAGNDTLNGGAGNDALTGDGGDDSLNGGNNSDTLIGGLGKDTLVGGAGNDLLDGGAGVDVLTGGIGPDVFRLANVSAADQINDFIIADLDSIHLANSQFTSLEAIGPLAGDLFRAGAGITNPADANDFLIYNTSTGDLFYDDDANGSDVAPIKIAVLGTSSHPALTHANFVVV